MTISKLRIVHVFRAPIGGLFRHVIDLATEQSARGHDVGLYFDASAFDTGVVSAIAKIPHDLQLGLGVTPIARGPGPFDLIAMRRFRKWASERKPDVIHGHGAKGGLLARVAGRASRVSRAIVAYTPHGGSFNYNPGTWQHWFYMKVECALARSTDLFLFESDFIANRFEALVGAKNGLIRRAYNGIRPEEFAAVDVAPDAADLLYVGELREAKGVDTLISAMAILARRKGWTPSLALVGSGPDRDIIKQRAEELGLGYAVRFHGPMPARKAFGLARLLVVPSRRESLPYIVLEAAAAGKSIVATSVGGVPEIFGPLCGRLIAPDDPQILAEAISARMARDICEKDFEASALREFVATKFSISGLAETVLAGYRDAILSH